MLSDSAVRFQASLQSFDSLLSLRWGPFVNQWVIQRNSVVGSKEIQFLRNERRRLEKKLNGSSASEAEKSRYAGVAEELECALQQKRVILFVSDFSPKVFDTLALGDMQRYGGYSRYTDAQDEKLRKEEEKKEREKQSKLNDLNMEIWGRNGVYDFVRNKRQDALAQGKSLVEMLGWKKAPWKKGEGLVDQFGRKF